MASAFASDFDEGYIMVDPNNATSSWPNDCLPAISSRINEISRDLRTLSLSIHDHPELGYKEFHAHRVLTEYFSQQDGWQVTSSAYDIKTAFIAVHDTGRKGSVVSFNAEYDALDGIGHACGHNLIAVMSVGAAMATAEVMRKEKLGGKVVLFGTPAEEGGGGKIKLLKAGAYRDHKVDISLLVHPGISCNAALVRTAAYSAFRAAYHGREAHAAARPWDGINALDALVIAYNGISVLRQQTQPGDIIQGCITNGGLRPNIIHAYAAGKFVVRAPTKERVDRLRERVYACFEGAAVATGARLEIKEGGRYDNHIPSRALGKMYREYFNTLGGAIGDPDLEEITAATQASTDQGNISHVIPSLHPSLFVKSVREDGKGQGGGPHTPDFEKAVRTEDAHEKAMEAAKALAGVAVECLVDRRIIDEAWKELRESKG